ncbi:hypothetical protein ACWD25_46575 [Streptomyces sp. NPDC002920]
MEITMPPSAMDPRSAPSSGPRSFGRLLKNFGSWHERHSHPDDEYRHLSSLFNVNAKAFGRLSLYTQIDATGAPDPVGANPIARVGLKSAYFRKNFTGHQVTSVYQFLSDPELDYMWLRVLDTPRDLSARTHGIEASLVLEVADSAGYRAGTWLLEGRTGRRLLHPDHRCSGSQSRCKGPELPVCGGRLGHTSVLGARYQAGAP